MREPEVFEAAKPQPRVSAVTETAVTVFLVVELDDLVLFCVKRHPAVHAALCLLKVRPRNQRPVEYVHSSTDHELYIADLVINTEQDLCALQTKLELLTNAQLSLPYCLWLGLVTRYR